MLASLDLRAELVNHLLEPLLASPGVLFCLFVHFSTSLYNMFQRLFQSHMMLQYSGNVVETVGNSEGIVQAPWVTVSVIHGASVSTTTSNIT